MSAPVRALAVRRAHAGETHDRVTLAYDDRLLRRRRLVTDGGVPLLVDLAAATALEEGDALEAEDGRLVAVLAAPEPLLEVRAASARDLARLAWHVGNRHVPARIEADRLLVRRDHVMRAMLEGLGAAVAEVEAPFVPEGGAYGAGRPMGHRHDHPGDPLGLGALGHG